MSETPIQRVGGPFDGVSANGWHVMLRHDDGTLESLCGPLETPNDAAVELQRLIAGVAA